MRPRILIGMLLLLGTLAVSTIAMGDGSVQPRQSAIYYLTEPTLIGSIIVQGPVVFAHDDGKMARGQECTTVYLLDPVTGRRTEEIASFFCIPTPRRVAHKFTVTTRPNTATGFGCVLTEFQFAGDSEGHGVPDRSPALASAEVSTEVGYAHQ